MTIPRFRDLLPRVLGRDDLKFQTTKPWECQTLYVVFATLALTFRGLPILLYFLLRRRRVILHWIGSDVLKVIRTPYQGWKSIAFRLLRRWIMSMTGIQHLVAAEHLKEELATLGIRKAKLMVVPGEPMRKAVQPLPEFPAALTYIPESRPEFYGLAKVLALAKANPDMTFHVVAHSGVGVDAADNVVFHGWVDRATMDLLYDKSTCVIRLVEHDALGGTVLEGVLRGRYAIWTYPAPYAYQARTIQEAQVALDQIKHMSQPNYRGADLVDEMYNYEFCVEQLRNELRPWGREG